MAVARASTRLKLCPRLATPYLPYRFATTDASKRNEPPRRAKPRRAVGHRFIHGDYEKFFHTDGTIFTTEANADFLRSHDITHDNGVASLIGPGMASTCRRFAARVQFDPRHILHPYDICYLNPGGHPLAPRMRATYAQRVHDEPLWVWVLTMSASSAIVRTMVQRRIKSAVFAALEGMGYGRSGKGQGGLESIQGTVLITLHDVVHVANLPAAEFGQAIAEVLHKQNGEHSSAKAMPPAKRDICTKKNSRAKPSSPTKGQKEDTHARRQAPAKRSTKGMGARGVSPGDFHAKFGSKRD